MILNVIVLILIFFSGYEVGLKRGKNMGGVCQDCLDEVFMQGYDAGAFDQGKYINLEHLLKESLDEVSKEPSDQKESVAKKAPKKAAKKKSKK